ncbi:hypothetical protein [Parasutterella sp.]|uniref:hypothetical protein n=1 Tax=Parasutterella sp. TaxID=2049037 RepID=UPI0035215F79
MKQNKTENQVVHIDFDNIGEREDWVQKFLDNPSLHDNGYFTLVAELGGVPKKFLKKYGIKEHLNFVRLADKFRNTSERKAKKDPLVIENTQQIYALAIRLGFSQKESALIAERVTKMAFGSARYIRDYCMPIMDKHQSQEEISGACRCFRLVLNS